MPHDLLIANGTIVDGTGGPRFDADVAVQGGRIAALGKFNGSAASIIDAAGKIVCPGFIDPHTHYDAQITWDRVLSSSAEHGVTTVVMGNCGVGIAPCRTSEREWLTDDLVTVEGIDKEVLAAGRIPTMRSSILPSRTISRSSSSCREPTPIPCSLPKWCGTCAP